MREFVGSLAILAIMICAGLYFAGWLTYDQTADRATIEIKTQEIKDAADRAIEKGEAIIDKATEPDSEAIDDERDAQEDRPQPPADDDGYRVISETNDSAAALIGPTP
jgi:hypothetical protein